MMVSSKRTARQRKEHAARAEARRSRRTVGLVQPPEDQRYLRRMRVVGIVGGAEEGWPGAMAMDVADHMPVRRQDRCAVDETRGGGLVDHGKFHRELPRDLVPENECCCLIRQGST